MNRLWVRLTIGFLLTFLLLLLLVTLVVNYSVTSSFRQYVNEMDVTNFGRTSFDSLTEYYRTHGTWAGADSLLPVAGNGQGGRSGRGMQSFVAGNDGVIVVGNQSRLGRSPCQRDWRRTDDATPLSMAKPWASWANSPWADNAWPKPNTASPIRSIPR